MMGCAALFPHPVMMPSAVPFPLKVQLPGTTHSLPSSSQWESWKLTLTKVELTAGYEKLVEWKDHEVGSQETPKF